MKALLAAAALMLLATTAQAATFGTGSPQSTLPKEFHGNWCMDTAGGNYLRKHCPENDGTLTVKAKSFQGWEQSCRLQTATPYGRGGHAYLARFKCTGEDRSTWVTTYYIFIEEGRLNMTD